MASRAKKVVGVVVGIIVVLAIAAAIGLHPYYAMPPESKADLDARYAQYAAVLRSTPSSQADFDALNALGNESAALKPYYPLLKKDCPLFDVAELKSRADDLNKLAPLEDRLRELLSRPPVVLSDRKLEGRLVDFKGLREFAYGEDAAAALDQAEGRADAAINRLALVRRFEGALERGGPIIRLMIGVVMGEYANRTTAYLLPGLSDAAVAQAREQIEKLPDLHQSFVACMQSETGYLVDYLDHVSQARVPSSGRRAPEPMDANDAYFSHILAVARPLGLVTRERYMTLSVAGGQIEAMKKWAAAGGAAPPPDVDANALNHSVYLMMAFPNFTKLGERIHLAMTQRAALLTAMNRELERRKTHDERAVAVPYDDKNEIVIEKEYGCIRPKAGAAK